LKYLKNGKQWFENNHHYGKLWADSIVLELAC